MVIDIKLGNKFISDHTNVAAKPEIRNLATLDINIFNDTTG